MTVTHPTKSIRNRLAIALDVPSVDEATTLANAVAPYFGIAKVGLQLFSAHGPNVVKRILATGLDVFLDVKLHDIPNTVRGAAEALGQLGVRMVTVHAAGEVPMIAAAVEGLGTGARRAGHPAPMVLAVTVLTSASSAPNDVLAERAAWAAQAGAGGVVCAVPDLKVITAAAPGLIPVCPGIRLAGGDTHDQQRVATPRAAFDNGAGILVIGRAVSGASNPAAVAARIADELGTPDQQPG